jgi:uncharacterized protein with ParB-like and HNH nuclease domain
MNDACDYEYADDLDEEEIFDKSVDFGGITTYTVGNSVRTIIDMIDQGIINLKPEFQREFVWDIKRASKLIDSILSNLPIPNLLLGRYRKTEKFDVIDGQQRLKTIYSFIKNEFNDSGTKKPFILRGLDNRNWNEKSFKDLDDLTQRKILNFTINSTLLENIDDDPKVIFEIFNRLNTGGIPLRSQEVRNCIFSGQFNEVLKKLNTYPPWRKLLGRDKPNKRMDDIELILRFYSLCNGKYYVYRAPMLEWLNDSMKNKNQSTKEFEELFTKTVDKVNSLFDTNVFKGKGRVFNRAIFDAIMITVSEGIVKNNIVDNAKEKYTFLLENEDFAETLEKGTTDPKKVVLRINLAKEYLLKN